MGTVCCPKHTKMGTVAEDKTFFCQMCLISTQASRSMSFKVVGVDVVGVVAVVVGGVVTCWS